MKSKTSRLRSALKTAIGITMVELMIVVAIIAIVLAAAFPAIIESLRNQEVYEAAKEISMQIKRQRHKAQKFNRAMGIRISSASNNVVGWVSGTNRCSDINFGDAGEVLFDVATDHDEAKILPTTWDGVNICIRPNNSVNNEQGFPFSEDISTPAVNGTLFFEVARADGVGTPRTIKLPYNGIARLTR